MKPIREIIFWSWAPITLLGKFRSTFILFLSFLFSISIFNNALAREAFKFEFGSEVRVLSDKAFRSSKDNRFEAVGNVVINHGVNAIYGEKASMSFLSGETDVVGNVRYVGADMTLYGSKLRYNFKNNFMSVQNARVLSDNFVVLGKEITKVSDGEIIGIETEYTTCRDCPESWSIFGKRIRITLGEYVRIYNAYIKVNGVVVMYLPYIILPIKKNRESGLLFPSFGVESDEGIRFQQPWFWAINNSVDATFTPSVWGKRGIGGELQYRQVLAEKSWFEINSLTAWDRVYAPEKLNLDITGEKPFRTISDYEHHWSHGYHWNHHLYLSEVNDLDIIRDFDFRSNEKVLGPEVGKESFLEFRSSLFNINAEGYYNRNQLVVDAKEFDHDYVQILPKISLSTTPFNILQTDIPGLSKVSLGVDSDFTIFKQNHFNEGTFIRNAHRINANPYIDWKLGYWGPVSFKTKALLEYQYYNFPYETDGRYFSKRGIIYETEAKLEIEKIFGLAYNQEVETKRLNIDKLEDKNKNKQSQLVGTLPKIDQGYTEEKITIRRNSYRYNQEYKMKHYFLSDQRTKGSTRFANQIRDENGQFDPTDAIREKENELSNVASRTSVPVNNTIELQWNNSVIRKSAKQFNVFEDERYLRQNFEYSRIAYFYVSQGYDFNIETDDLKQKLTRLHVEGGFSMGNFSLSASEFYFYDTDESIFYLNLGRQFSRGRLDLSMNLDSFSIPVNKFVSVSGEYDVTDLIQLRAELDYDVDEERSVRSLYGLLYSPVNNCWKLDFNYESTLVDKRYSVNVLINFNENSFTGIAER